MRSRSREEHKGWIEITGEVHEKTARVIWMLKQLDFADAFGIEDFRSAKVLNVDRIVARQVLSQEVVTQITQLRHLHALANDMLGDLHSRPDPLPPPCPGWKMTESEGAG